MKSIVVIPARYKSSRFPGKPLVKLLGKEMILWVAELSSVAVGMDNVYVATDDKRISDVVLGAGFNVVMTSSKCLTGTDRLAEVATKIDADIYVNVQGDEPLVSPADIVKVMELKKKFPNDIINAYCTVSNDESPDNINTPKVIFTEDERLVYMSRIALPGFKEKSNKPPVYYKQVCIYAFNKEELLAYANYGRKSNLEHSEDIEIIRFLEWGKTIRMSRASQGSLAVDVEGDVSGVEEALERMQGA